MCGPRPGAARPELAARPRCRRGTRSGCPAASTPGSDPRHCRHQLRYLLPVISVGTKCTMSRMDPSRCFLGLKTALTRVPIQVVQFHFTQAVDQDAVSTVQLDQGQDLRSASGAHRDRRADGKLCTKPSSPPQPTPPAWKTALAVDRGGRRHSRIQSTRCQEASIVHDLSEELLASQPAV